MNLKAGSVILATVMLVSCSDGSQEDNWSNNIPLQESTFSKEAYVTEQDAPPSEDKQTDIKSELTPIYDTDPISEAYRSGDDSKLSDKDKEIYYAAVAAIGNFHNDGMSEMETVIAAHDWIVTHTTYDKGMLLPIPEHSPDSVNPYGVLINGESICMGYTTTFHMFMDMLGVESVIVRGSSDGEEHAWNMVKLGEKWYHVDVTWDDFIPDEPDRQAFHLYTLVTDSVMKDMHVWDDSATEPADDDSLIYYKIKGLYADTKDEVEQILNATYESGAKTAEVMTPNSGVQVFKNVSSYWIVELGEYTVTLYWFR